MDSCRKDDDRPRIRRRWMVVAVITLQFVILFLGVGPVGNPDVTATFTFTNNAFPVDGGAPGEGAMVLVELAWFPRRGHAPGTNRAPGEVMFHLRRQDTAMEEGREMLDSVLRSAGVAAPGLNSDSEQNKFEIVAEFPAYF